MASGDAGPPVDHTEMYRGMLLIAAVAVPAFALVAWDAPYDPIAPRLGFSATALACFAGSYRWEWLRRRIRLAVHLLCYALFAWFMFVATVHDMGLEDGLGLLPVVVGAAVSVRRAWEVAALVVYMMTVLAIAYATVATPAVDASVHASLFGVFAVCVGWMTVWRSRLEAQLQVANATLEARVAERTASLERAAAERAAAERRANAANEAKSRFLANMSHELRTPLNAVIGYSELVEAELAGSDKAHHCEDLEKVGRAARHLLTIIDNVLDLSRVEAGALALRREPVALAGAIEEAAALVRPQLLARGDRLVVEVADGSAVRGDREALVRVLAHLLDNAAKFTADGTITVAAARADAVVTIEVRDTGAGIPEAALARIFERFTQADDSSTRMFGGAGLGLAICRELVTRMDGTLTVASAVGQGSVFTVRLPAAAHS
jgi:signal transduction histidine kinase